MGEMKYRLSKKKKIIGLILLAGYLIAIAAGIWTYMTPRDWHAPEPASMTEEIHKDFSFAETPEWQVTRYDVRWRQGFWVELTFTGDSGDYQRFRENCPYALPEALDYESFPQTGVRDGIMYAKDFAIPELTSGRLHVNVINGTCTLTLSKKGIANISVLREMEKDDYFVDSSRR